MVGVDGGWWGVDEGWWELMEGGGELMEGGRGWWRVVGMFKMMDGRGDGGIVKVVRGDVGWW